MRKNGFDRSTLPDLSDETLRTDPLERSETIPSSWYVDQRFHDFDTEAIFARTWQGVGHADQVRRPGDRFPAMVADNPIVVLRDMEGTLRAFYNVCRHRGGPLATCADNGSMLQCGYHGWTYRLDGSLRGVPKFDRVELFDRRDYGLVPVHVELWQGIIFVNLDPNPQPLTECVAGITERIAPISLESKRFFRQVQYTVDCNWKVYIDNYLEGYHVPLVHPELMTMLDYNNYTTETFPRYSLQYSPLSEGENIYGTTGGEAFYYFLFPNFMLNILPGRLQTNLVVPLAHDRTLVTFDYFYDDIESPEALKIIEDDIECSDRIQREDIEICEHVQRGIRSRAYDRGRFSVACEGGVHHFQTMVKEAYRQELERGQEEEGRYPNAALDESATYQDPSS